MILEGDLVLDWMGRIGVTIDKTNPPDCGEMDPIFDQSLKELRETETWWLVALFSGSVVKSPELLTESYGKAKVEVLRWAFRRCEPNICSLLATLLERDQIRGVKGH
jgi:hypothetical protein